MNNEYKAFLKRLVQYRIRLNMTQEIISEKLGITQSQLSKQELGKTIVPYRSLVEFMKLGWDVDYLLTGKGSLCKESELTKILGKTDEKYYKTMLEFMAWILAAGVKKSVSVLSTEEKCEISILKMKSSNNINKSIIYEIRKTRGEAQMVMAEKLGVNIKKYRALERQQVYPDAELLLGIYQMTGCKPSLFLTTKHIEKVIIDDLWERIDLENRNEIIEIISHIDCFMKM